jgi:hypothetical protein
LVEAFLLYTCTVLHPPGTPELIFHTPAEQRIGDETTSRIMIDVQLEAGTAKAKA